MPKRKKTEDKSVNYTWSKGNPDEVLKVWDQIGICGSKSCANNLRWAQATVYRNGTLIFRCKKCGEFENFHPIKDHMSSAPKGWNDDDP